MFSGTEMKTKKNKIKSTCARGAFPPHSKNMCRYYRAHRKEVDMLGRVGGCMPVINLNSFCVKWRREEKHCKMSEKAQQTKKGGFLTRPSPHQKSRALPSIPRKSHGHSAFWKGQDSISADRDGLGVSRGAW